ncbi:olfactory receptor 6N2-like [Branchiostoma floridae]|uniref:Olfactory receptor 6N2-like n=1 Tax=Branchiostoma floridae TaxID=7739 RepID=A0A9J7MXJ5_BRAFL|nr:olfactory receptor 6N2-like [Branchiostoma floridae]
MAEDDQLSAWNSARSLGSASLGLQTAYLIFSLVVAVGCGLLVVYLVYKKDYLQKPSNYLRCSLSAYDIIFMCCMIPMDIYVLYQADDSNGQTVCWVREQLFRWFTTSMSGTYVLMAMELYYFICQPLHYHQKVTTKRVAAGTVVVLALSLMLRVVYITIEKVENPNTTSQCGLQSADITGPTAVIQHIMTGLVVLAFLIIFISYFLIFKEARKQQERDEHRDLWLYQTKAFKRLAPHAISLAVWVGTIVLLVVMTRQALGKEASFPLRITTRIAVLLYTTLSSMVNPIVYSFRMPDFRRALRETFGWPSNAPVAQAPPPHGQQGQDLEMAVFSVPGHGQGGSTIQVAEAPPSSRLTQVGEDTSNTTCPTNKAGGNTNGADPAPKMMQTEGTLSKPSLQLSGIQPE